LKKKEKRLSIAKEIYNEIAGRKISLATPILINLRRPNGNLSSCFVSAVDDSLDSIFYNVNAIAQISKNGGGVGVNLSRIRATGSEIKKTPNASGGVIPWIKIINDTAVAVNQLGKRAGAVTAALDIWHLDIEDFLELQTENGDQRKNLMIYFRKL
jgi:Ribonucleotide reductase, alpha subunit